MNLGPERPARALPPLVKGPRDSVVTGLAEGREAAIPASTSYRCEDTCLLHFGMRCLTGDRDYDHTAKPIFDPNRFVCCMADSGQTDLNDFGPSDFRFKPTGSFELVRLYSSRHFGFLGALSCSERGSTLPRKPWETDKKTP